MGLLGLACTGSDIAGFRWSWNERPKHWLHSGNPSWEASPKMLWFEQLGKLMEIGQSCYLSILNSFPFVLLQISCSWSLWWLKMDRCQRKGSMTFPCPGNHREETRVSTVSMVLYLSYGLCPTRFLSWFQAARIHIARAPFWAGNTFCQRPLGGVGCTNRFLFNFFNLSVVGMWEDEIWRPPAPHWGEKSYHRNKPTAHIPSEKPPAANPAWSLQARVGAERETSLPLFALVGSSLLKPWLLLSFLPFIVSSGKPRASEAAFHPHRRF